MASKTWALKWAVLVIGLLALVPCTMQLSMNHPLHSVVSRINDDGPYLGLVLSSASDEKELRDSGYFVPNPRLSYVKIAGRTFYIGTFKNLPAIYIVTQPPIAALAATVQLLTDFNLVGIIDYGNAASVSKKLAVGDVAVLSHTAFTGVWSWKAYNSDLEAGDVTSLKFGEFNVPEAGDNKLASVAFQQIKKYTPNGSNKLAFWYYVDKEWFAIASRVKDVTLEKCAGENTCADDKPKVVFGVRGSSSDVLLSNEAYGKFLNEKLNVTTIDRKSAAVVSTAVANALPHVVVRGASNKPGVAYDKNLASVATKNTLKFVAAFVDELLFRQNLNKYF